MTTRGGLFLHDEENEDVDDSVRSFLLPVHHIAFRNKWQIFAGAAKCVFDCICI